MEEALICFSVTSYKLKNAAVYFPSAQFLYLKIIHGVFMVLWIIIIALTVLLDQATKLITTVCLEVGETVKVIPGLINFTHIKNTGAAWGMFSDARWIFLLVSAAAIILLPILLYKYRKVHFLFGFSLSLIIGGAIGNMIDRLFAENGGVTDFIEFAFIDFPIFNVADICVCVGAVLMFIYLAFLDKTFFQDDKKKKERISEKPETSESKEEKHD